MNSARFTIQEHRSTPKITIDLNPTNESIRREWLMIHKAPFLAYLRKTLEEAEMNFDRIEIDEGKAQVYTGSSRILSPTFQELRDIAYKIGTIADDHIANEINRVKRDLNFARLL